MRSRGVRLDLFICMVLAALIFYGVYEGGSFVIEKMSAVKDSVETQASVGNETGCIPSEDVPVVETFRELGDHGDCFTFTMNRVRLYDNGSIVGENYEWRFVEIEDYIIAARVNMDNLTEGSSYTYVTLPVGRLILAEPEVLDEMQVQFRGEGTIIDDAFIDMDGAANSTKISAFQDSLMTFGMLLVVFVPIVLFAAYIGLVFGIHAIGYKLGIFPPVFNKNR